MKSDENIAAWLEQAPAEVRSTTERLMAEVDRMRSTDTIYPAQHDILNALAYVAPGDVRVVILGQDPYHEPGQAMGLSFSVPEGCKIPPSLRNIYKELSADLGCSVPASGDLTAWAQAGVLLLNTTLTVREHAANSHAKLGWQVLTNYVLETCMALPQAVVFLAWGRPAIRLIEGARAQAEAASGKYVQAGAVADTDSATGVRGGKLVLASTHPSPLSANRGSADLPAFIGSRPFSRANAYLQSCGEAPIDWAQIS